MLTATTTSVARDGDILPTYREGGQLGSELIDRARSEFREMPGMQLTSRQAARLWGVDAATSESLLSVLVAAGFLRRRGEHYAHGTSV